MRLITIILILTGFLYKSYSQHDFLFERKSLQDLRMYENSINSVFLGFTKIQVAKDYFPTAKENHDYYPLCYNRINDNFFPQLKICYYYDEKDSSLLSASYDWNIMDYVKNLKTDGDKFDIEINREKEYLKKYKDIKQQLVDKFGEPSIVEEVKTGDGYFYRLRWENESNKILVLLKFSTKLKVLSGDMKIGSYNIRVKIDYKK